MSKNKIQKKHNEIIDLDFSGDEIFPGDEAVAGMMSGLLEVSHQQQMMAIELTKLVVQKSTENMKEEHIFSTFERAINVVTKHFPMKELWEKFS